MIRTAIALIFFLFFSTPVLCKKEFKCEEFIALFPPFVCPSDSLLGAGAFGQAFLVTSSTQKRVVKVSAYIDGTSEREFELLSRLEHPNILKAYQAAVKDGYYFMMTDYGAKGSLFAYSQANPTFMFDYQRITELFTKVVEAVAYLHKNGMVHTDIKPDNIIITDELEPKLIDFDLAVPLRSTQTFRGTLVYAEPGLMRNFASSDHVFTYDSHNDVFALGVTLYWLTQKGQVPFDGRTRDEIGKLHQVGTYKIAAGTPVELAQIIHACLRSRKRDRIGIENLRTYLNKLTADDLNRPVKTDLTLNIATQFPYRLWLESKGRFSLWEEFAEMIFIFATAFILIPLTVYCLKRKVDSHIAAQQRALNRPLNQEAAPRPEMVAGVERPGPEIVVQG